MNHSIYLIGRHAICSVCSGLIQAIDAGNVFRCNDCTSRFEVTGCGLTDNGLEVRRIGGGVNG